MKVCQKCLVYPQKNDLTINLAFIFWEFVDARKLVKAREFQFLGGSIMML